MQRKHICNYLLTNPPSPTKRGGGSEGVFPKLLGRRSVGCAEVCVYVFALNKARRPSRYSWSRFPFQTVNCFFPRNGRILFSSTFDRKMPNKRWAVVGIGDEESPTVTVFLPLDSWLVFRHVGKWIDKENGTIESRSILFVRKYLKMCVYIMILCLLRTNGQSTHCY